MALHMVVAGNIEKCRTEVEISDHTGDVVAIVYEDVMVKDDGTCMGRNLTGMNA
jgi:hypothetical protein